jgi:hypothetical protein
LNLNELELKLKKKLYKKKTLHQWLCQEIFVSPQHHLMLLMLQTERIQILRRKRYRDAAEN